MSKKRSRKNITNKRITTFLLLFIVLGALIIARLFYVQIIKNKEYTKMALERMTRSEDIVSARGDIYDRNGKKLAINVSASTVYVNGEYFKDGKSEYTKEQIADALTGLIGVNKEDILEMIDSGNRVKVKQWVDQDIAMKIKDLGMSPIEVVDGTRRFYPYGNSASHLIGFTNIDNVGQYGVEASYNVELSGKPGKWLKSVDANNKQMPLAKEEVFEPNDGMSLVLTMDKSIQEIVDSVAQETLESNGADKVSIIVQDTKTGDILAMANYPEYNLNFPKEPINDEQKKDWEGLSDEDIVNQWYENWRNFAVNDIYEPGSTFKIITAASALEENVTNPNQHYYCTGYIRDIPGEILSCIDTHGDLTLKEGLTKSCNSTFVQVGRELGVDNFYRYIKAFGFGEKTGIRLPSEQSGIIPKSAESIKNVDLATMSYGHGIAVTPIQIVSATSAIANGGKLMVPRVAKELINNNGAVIESFPVEVKRQVISESTSKTMLELMHNVVEEGSGRNAKVVGFRVGGKTGTATKPVAQGYSENEYNASFVGVAPVDNPKITVLVIVDNPKGTFWGSTVAAPAAQKVIEGSLEYLGVARDDKIENENGTLSTANVAVPNVRNMFIGDAGKKLTNSGIKYSTDYVDIDDYTVVENQSIEPGEIVPNGTIVDLKLYSVNKKIVPSMLGKTLAEAKKILDEKGIAFESEGEGFISKQEPEPGAKYQDDTIFKFTLSEDYVDEDATPINLNIKDDNVKVQDDSASGD
ncbi:MAG: PASTA domain-containing protein [Tissierellia bacterium]|nr:PASTA domain-containing protein [Tissierellia bacterium]